MIISIIVLLLMISTFIGAAHFENGVLSIEPNSRNLIIYADNTPTDNAISVRGPYTVDTAIENESYQIRMPSDAMMTLGIKSNDTIQINDEIYIVNETRPGEPGTLRLPIEVKKALNVESEDIIQDSRLKEVFEGVTVNHSYENNNTTFTESFTVSSRNVNASSFEVIVNNVSIANSTGIFNNGSLYYLAVNGEPVSSMYDLNNTNFTYEGYDVEIIFKDTNSTSIKQFLRSDRGNFLNFYF